MDFIDSRTYSNLKTAYERELQISAKDLIYSDIARNDGYIEISEVFDTTARNNKEHARIWLRRLGEGQLPTTAEVLSESVREETEMANNMYQEFARIAREEGYNDIAALFSGVSNIDFNHSSTFQVLYENVISEEVFCKPEENLWICMQCGNIMAGECAPVICPVCGFPQGYYREFDPQIEY